MELYFEKVTALPGTLTGSTMYLLADGVEADRVDVHLTNIDGTESRALMSGGTMDTKIQNVLDGFSNIRVVSTITDRNALTASLNAFTLVMVTDASEDTTVGNGAAMYLYNPDTGVYTKVYEFEGIDIELAWDDIIGKPASTVAELDATATSSHSHDNATVLDAVSEQNSNLLYNGVEHTGFAGVSELEW